jgi:raffinose/stachyose/melibiose transport system substrate-binding protein
MTVLLALLTGAQAMADTTVTMFQLKVEIKDALDGYAAKYSAAHPGTTVSVETLGGGADYGGALKAKVQAGQMPDIFVIEGQGGYNVWKDYAADLSDQPWVKDTSLGFKVGGKIYGFPVAMKATVWPTTPTFSRRRGSIRLR